METGPRVLGQEGKGKRGTEGERMVREPHWQSGEGRTLLLEPGRGTGLPRGLWSCGEFRAQAIVLSRPPPGSQLLA